MWSKDELLSLLGLLYTVWLLTALTVSAEEPHHTTAFIGASGDVDLLVSYSNYSTRHFWDRSGKKHPTHNKFEKHSCQCFGEYALNGLNSMFFNARYSRVEESLNGNSQGFEDAEVGWKRLIWGNKRSAFTGQIVGIIPPQCRKASVRYGIFGGEADLIFSQIFKILNRCGWYDLIAGYRAYSGYPSDQIRLGGSVGYYILRNWRVIATCRLNYGVYNGKAGHRLNNVVLNPNYRLLTSQIECDFKLFSHFSLALGVFKHMWGRGIGTGGGCFGGIWFDF